LRGFDAIASVGNSKIVFEASDIISLKYTTLILSIVFPGSETLSLTLKEEHRLGCLKTGCLGEYLKQRGMKWHKAGENGIMRSSIIGTLHKYY
jgi:hypothetical protein